MKKTTVHQPMGGIMPVMGLALLLTCLNASASSLIFGFSPTLNSTIQFNGSQNSFSFNPGFGGYQWSITSETGGNSALGLNGSITPSIGSSFDYGPITTSGSGFSQVQSATVLGPLGNLVISDGASGNLTGTVNWINIATFYTVGGFLNAQVNVNLSNVLYSGLNPDLQTLQSNQPGIVDVSFQFAPGENLSSLSLGTGPYTTTSFSGSITTTPVPEPASIALAGLGGLTLLLFRRQRK
jgi:hypothetical protein